jgi:hypothetical protein
MNKITSICVTTLIFLAAMLFCVWFFGDVMDTSLQVQDIGDDTFMILIRTDLTIEEAQVIAAEAFAPHFLVLEN